MIGVDPNSIAMRTYTGVWSFLVKWFRVPEHPPSLPTAPGEQVVAFKPSEAYLRYLKVLFWIVIVIIDAILAVLWLAATIALIAVDLWFVAIPLAPIALALIVVPDIIAYVAIHLRYDTTWYVLSHRSLRLRHGIWLIREMTLTFENVQNVRLAQGPLQRVFGISSVVVDTAGGGGAMGPHGQAGSSHNAAIEGVTNAEEIRDLILSRVRASRSAGLGDEHSVVRGGAKGTASSPGAAGRSGVRAFGPGGRGAVDERHLALLRAIRDELRAASGAA